MGHANLTDLSKCAIRQVYARGKASLQQMLDKAVALPYYRAEYKDDPEPTRSMLGMFLVEIINFYLHRHAFTPQGKRTPVFQACDMNPSQQAFYQRSWKTSHLTKTT